MVSTEVKVGVSCNNNCVFCLNDRRDWDKSFEDIKREIDAAKYAGVDKINFTGGEVTIRKDFFDIIDYTKKKGLKIEIQTNGRAFYYKNFAKKVCDYGISSFLVSLHAHTRELYKQICSVDGYDQATGGIKNLLELNSKVIINCVVSKYNVEKIFDIAQHHVILEAKHLQFGWVKPSGKALKQFDDTVITFKENIHHLFKAIDWLDENFKGTFNILGVPFCLLGKRSFFKANEYFGNVFIKEKSQENLNRNPSIQKKSKISSCSGCIYNHRCEGIFSEYLKMKGDSEFLPVEKKFLNILGVVGFFPEKYNNKIPNYGAHRVTNELLLNFNSSDKVDKILYFVEYKEYINKRHLQSSKVKILPIESINYYATSMEYDFSSFYCIYRNYMKLLENFRFKKIALIHSQDSPDILETYGRYVFEFKKKNCMWISPSKVGKEITLDIFHEFEFHKGKKKYNHRIEVIPWGIDGNYKGCNKKTGDTVKLLYFGRINSIYKADLVPLFGVFGRLKNIYSNIELHLAGNITDEEHKRISGYFGKNIIYHGEISEGDKLRFMREHDILISPVNSIQETFGVTLLEAASQGLVCIGTDWNGYDELLSEDNLINTKVLPFSLDLPVGVDKMPEFRKACRYITSRVIIDWDDCYAKLIYAIDSFKRGNSRASLKVNIENYFWKKIVSMHEDIWFSEDSYEVDDVSIFQEGLTIPSNIFLKNDLVCIDKVINKTLEKSFGINISHIDSLDKNSGHFRITSDKGIFFLKKLFFVPESGTTTFLSTLENFRNHVKNGGISVLEPLMTSDGRKYLKILGFFYELYPFFEDLGEVKNEILLAKIMAKMHMLPDIVDSDKNTNTSIKRINNVLKRLGDSELKCMIQELKVFEMSTDKRLLHGDLHPGNLVMVADEIKLMDFDLICYGSKSYDLGKTLCGNFFFSDDKLDEDKVKRFISEYFKNSKSDMQVTSNIFKHMILNILIRIYSLESSDDIFTGDVLNKEIKKLDFLMKKRSVLDTLFNKISSNRIIDHD